MEVDGGVRSLRLRSRACLLRLISFGYDSAQNSTTHSLLKKSKPRLSIFQCVTQAWFHNSGAKTLKNPFNFVALLVPCTSAREIPIMTSNPHKHQDNPMAKGTSTPFRIFWWSRTTGLLGLTMLSGTFLQSISLLKCESVCDDFLCLFDVYSCLFDCLLFAC